MKNAVLPSFSSPLCSFGNIEAISDVSLQTENKINVYSNSFGFDSKVYNNHNQLLGGFANIPSHQSLINYQPGYQTSTSSYDNISQPSMFHNNQKFSVPQLESGFQAIQNARKRPIDVHDLFLPIKGINEVVGHDTTLNDSKKNKKKKAMDEPIDIQEYRVPVRRSQKVGDKITALQKLVSPYGKTDTASVLQEASVYIKLVQEEIQRLSISYFGFRSLHSQKIEGKQLDLQSRGLCLVPVSFTQNLTKEDCVDHHATSRRTIIPRDF